MSNQPTTDRLAEVLEKLTAIREVVREAHFALDDSEDQSHLYPPVHVVPCDNANRLDAALTACEAFMPDDEAWYGPGPLVTQVMDSLQSLSTDLAKAEARAKELELKISQVVQLQRAFFGNATKTHMKLADLCKALNQPKEKGDD